MSWLNDTIAGRTVIVMVFGLGSILVLAHYLYQSGLERELTTRNTDSIIERLLTIADSLEKEDADWRDEAAHRLSGGTLELHWGREPLAVAGGLLDQTMLQFRERLLTRLTKHDKQGLVIGTSRSDGAGKGDKDHDTKHTTLISIALRDGSWLNVTLARVETARLAAPSLIISMLLGALAVVILAGLLGRWLTGPLDRLAAGAQNLSLTEAASRLPTDGTREVRTLASAINDLQDRNRRLVRDRTQMLAAISHDLRTPLTRLRLRAEYIREAQVRGSISADLCEMEEMIDATLTFLRDDMTEEKIERVDIEAILETIASDADDSGKSVTLDAPHGLVIAGRHLALKRALTNLVQNAIKYGERATVTGRRLGAEIRISITDEGPGIPAGQLEAVFEPFYRLETSRGRGTGGHGLGLTIARSIVRAHGGDIVLANRSPLGLEATVTLPIDGPRRS